MAKYRVTVTPELEKLIVAQVKDGRFKTVPQALATLAAQAMGFEGKAVAQWGGVRNITKKRQQPDNG